MNCIISWNRTIALRVQMLCWNPVATKQRGENNGTTQVPVLWILSCQYWKCEQLAGVLAPTLACPSTRIYLYILIHKSHIFPCHQNILLGGNGTYWKSKILICLLILRGCKPRSLFFDWLPTYHQQSIGPDIVIAANFFHPPTTPRGLALSQNFWSWKTYHFSDPT